MKYALHGIGTTTGRPHTMTACRCKLKLAGDVRPCRKAASSSCGFRGCPRGLTPCCRCCSYVSPEEAADVAAGSTAVVSAAGASSPAADAASPPRTASNRWAADWYQRGSGIDPLGAHFFFGMAPRAASLYTRLGPARNIFAIGMTLCKHMSMTIHACILMGGRLTPEHSNHCSFARNRILCPLCTLHD